MFDGLELHLYTLVAVPLAIQLLHATSPADPAVKEKAAYIQAAFLIGFCYNIGRVAAAVASWWLPDPECGA